MTTQTDIEAARKHSESEGDNGNAEISFLAGIAYRDANPIEKRDRDVSELVTISKIILNTHQNLGQDQSNELRRAEIMMRLQEALKAFEKGGG